MKRVSQRESDNSYLFLYPHNLSKLPGEGETFIIKTKEESFETTVSTINCSCNDSNKPHTHKVLPLKNVKIEKGNVILLKKISDKEYFLEK